MVPEKRSLKVRQVQRSRKQALGLSAVVSRTDQIEDR